MNLSDILKETPYLHPGSMPITILDGTVSVSAIKRDYRQVGKIGDLTALIDRQNSHVILVDSNDTGTERVRQHMRIQFKRRHDINFKHAFNNLLQVDKVAISPDHGLQGIATGVYKMLADSGFTIVSDNTQFDPAQAMWRKLASDPAYKVYVADVDHGIFKDDNGTPIVYTGKNIPDQDIWTSGSDMNGNYRVMILTK